MKNFIFLILLCNTKVFSQEISLEKTRDNVLYRNVQNPVTAIIETINCDSIYLKSIDAEIIKVNDCSFNIISDSEKREITINFYQIKNKDTLFVNKQVSRLVDIPKPIFNIFGKVSGKLTEKDLKNLNHTRFSAYLDPSFGCVNFKLSSFRIIIIRDNKIIGSEKNIGHKASTKTQELISKAKSGDIIHFLDIECKNLELNPVKFEVM